MLNSVSLRGVPSIRRVFLQEHDKVHNEEGAIKTTKEWMLETDGVNLKTVRCVEGVDFTRQLYLSLLGPRLSMATRDDHPGDQAVTDVNEAGDSCYKSRPLTLCS